MKPFPPVPLPLPRRPAAAGAQRAPQRTAVGRPEAKVDRQAAADGLSGLMSHLLVGGLEHFLFSIIYGIILPID